MVRFIRSVWELTELRVFWRLKNVSCVVKIRRLFTCGVFRDRGAHSDVFAVSGSLQMRI